VPRGGRADTGAADADRLSIICYVGKNDDFRAARHTPPLAEDIELDLAETASKRDLLFGSDPLMAKKDHAVFVIGVFDRSEGAVVYRFRQIEAADFCGQGTPTRNNL
jgi:hypothetical protein